MKFSLRAAAFVVGIAVMLLSAGKAKADDFQFSFSGGAFSASGMFMTDPVGQSPQFGTVNEFTIEGLTGMLNGLSMTLNNPGDSAIFQSSLNLPTFGPGVIFTAGGTQYELEFNEGPHPAGTDDLLVNLGNNTVTNVALNVSAVSVPEPSEVAMALLALCGLAGACKAKGKFALARV
jgi:hypothetical protein